LSSEHLLRAIQDSASASGPPSRAIRDKVLRSYLFFRAFFLDSLVFACSLDFFRLRRRLISFCRSLAIEPLFVCYLV
jgi:hypothetical protein